MEILVKLSHVLRFSILWYTSKSSGEVGFQHLTNSNWWCIETSEKYWVFIKHSKSKNETWQLLLCFYPTEFIDQPQNLNTSIMLLSCSIHKPRMKPEHNYNVVILQYLKTNHKSWTQPLCCYPVAYIDQSWNLNTLCCYPAIFINQSWNLNSTIMLFSFSIHGPIMIPEHNHFVILQHALTIHVI